MRCYGLAQGSTGVPCPPFVSSSTRFLSAEPGCIYVFSGIVGFSLHCVVWSVRLEWGGGEEEGREKEVSMVIWGPYLKRFSPAPSSHWGRCTLIRCAGTQDPRRQQ